MKANKLLALIGMTEEGGGIYQQLKDAGVQLDNHESDLYALVTPESEKIVAEYPHKSNVRKFKGSDGKMWFDIPFAYEPYWDKK